MCFTNCVYTWFKGVTLVNTQRHEDTLGDLYVGVCVCMCCMRTQLLVSQKIPLRAPSTGQFKLTHTEASLVVVWRPRRSLWIVCTHRSRLPTAVASEWFAVVWAIAQKSYLSVCQLCPCVTAKRMRHAKTELPLGFCRKQVVPRVTMILVIIHFEEEAPLIVSFPGHTSSKKKPILWFKKHMTRIVMIWQYMYKAFDAKHWE